MAITINSPTQKDGVLSVGGSCNASSHDGHTLSIIIWDNAKPKNNVTRNFTVTGPTLNTSDGSWSGTVIPIPKSDFTIEVDCTVGEDEETASTPVG